MMGLLGRFADPPEGGKVVDVPTFPVAVLSDLTDIVFFAFGLLDDSSWVNPKVPVANKMGFVSLK